MDRFPIFSILILKTGQAYARQRVRARRGRAGTERGWPGGVPGVPDGSAQVAAGQLERLPAGREEALSEVRGLRDGLRMPGWSVDCA